MERIIKGRGTGKTYELMLKAKEAGAAIACMNPRAMQEKAYNYGITGLDFISYSELFVDSSSQESVMIDEMEIFVRNYIDCPLLGYTLTNED